MIVNFKVLISSAEWTFWAIFFVLGSIVSFFVIFGLLANIVDYSLFGTFDELIKMPEAYLTLTFFMFSYLLIDAGVTSVN